ncbi:MAG: cupredoxin domain-containing protein [Chloroflexi bacterium]|nr:cupredoxin domain-containing protein [Chloroflexota bacterium]
MPKRDRIVRIGVVAAVTGLLALAAACGGSPGAGSTPQVQSKPTGASAASATPAHTDHAAVIDQLDMAFKPARVSIKVGQTVLIKNSEAPIHTGNINGKNITGNMKKGDSTAWTATAPGEYKVTCDYHPQMSATIVVS